jgi:tetratricopeptide (TPR) repeat protein
LAEGEGKTPSSSTGNGFSLSSIIRPFGEQSESDRPFIPLVGGPRLFILLLYASVLIAASIEFFAGKNVWYGSWELYNTYVFTVSGVFVLIGIVMLFATKKLGPDDYDLPVPRPLMGMLGFIMLAASGITLVFFGKDIGAWAILLSVTLVYGFLMILLSVKGMGQHDSLRLTVYATGMIFMILVPVHEAFGVFRTQEEGQYFFTAMNLFLLIIGMFLALVAVQSLQTRDGYLGAWLIGAMAIFLIAFHEQLGIVASETYSPYDRGLALIGITFSFLPVAMYVWRERIYIFLWSRLKNANALIEAGDYKGALIHADAAIRQCSHAGIEDRFALPWSIKADAHYRLREYDKAKVFYETALKIDPNDSVTWSHLGNMYAFEGKQEEAMKAFDRALVIDPKNAEAWNNKGAVFQSLRMHEDALISFDKAISNDPTSFDAHMNKAKLLSRLGHSNEAVPEYQAALKIMPTSQDAQAGIQREFHRAKCLDVIDGWEQMGLDATPLRVILDQDPANFVRKTKEFLANVVEDRTQLTVLPSSEHIDVNAAIKSILRSTEEEGGATLDYLMEVTGLSQHNLILPLALLMETDHVHFKTIGRKQVYVSRGKAPEKPPEPPPPPPPEVKEEPEEAAPRKAKPKTKPKPEKKKAEKRKEEKPKIEKPKRRFLRRERKELEEPTASILVFSRKK